jgi:hypothetical protein
VLESAIAKAAAAIAAIAAIVPILTPPTAEPEASAPAALPVDSSLDSAGFLFFFSSFMLMSSEYTNCGKSTKTKDATIEINCFFIIFLFLPL